MKFPVHLLAAAALLLAGASPSARAADIQAVTQNAPPFAIQGGAQKGFLVDILEAVTKVMGTPVPVKFLPWAEAQKIAETTPNTLIFPMSRSPERDGVFDWVIEVWQVSIAFNTAPGKTPVNTLAEAKALKAVAVAGNSPWSNKLKAEGFTNIVEVRGAEAARKLAAGEVDAIYALPEEVLFNWRAASLQGKPVVGKEQQKLVQYIAGTKNSPAIKIEDWQGAFEVLKQDGTFDKIYSSYF